nr:hypothetical protein [uncultured Dongia sp.]
MATFYLLALIVTGAGWMIGRRGGRPVWSFAAVGVGLLLSYGLAMTALCIDPYFEDNGLPEFIEWRFRWMWAAEFAAWISVIAVPIVLISASFAQARRAKR